MQHMKQWKFNADLQNGQRWKHKYRDFYLTDYSDNYIKEKHNFNL